MSSSSGVARKAFKGAGLLLCAMAPFVAVANPPEVGDKAPALVVPQLNGKPFDLATLHGKVVIVNFWATWCSPCRAEMPVLDSFYQHYRAKGVELLGLSIDDDGDRATVDTVMHKFSYPAAMMKSAKVNGFDEPLAVPTTYIVDSKGVIRARLTAGKTAVTEKSLTETITPLLPSAEAGGAK